MLEKNKKIFDVCENFLGNKSYKNKSNLMEVISISALEMKEPKNML